MIWENKNSSPNDGPSVISLEKEYPNGIPTELAAEVYKKAINNILKPGSEGRKAIDSAKGPVNVVVGVICPSQNPNNSVTPVPGISRPWNHINQPIF